MTDPQTPKTDLQSSRTGLPDSKPACKRQGPTCDGRVQVCFCRKRVCLHLNGNVLIEYKSALAADGPVPRGNRTVPGRDKYADADALPANAASQAAGGPRSGQKQTACQEANARLKSRHARPHQANPVRATPNPRLAYSLLGIASRPARRTPHENPIANVRKAKINAQSIVMVEFLGGHFLVEHRFEMRWRGPWSYDSDSRFP